MTKNKILFNLALLIKNKKLNNELISLSQNLHDSSPSFYTLGLNSYPHVTILQFEDYENSADSLWESLKALNVEEFKIHLKGMAIDFWNQWFCIWLRVRKQKNLQELQSQALSCLGQRGYLNGIEENYDPHLTLAAWPKQDKLPSFSIDLSIINLQSIDVYLALGKSGPNYQFSEIYMKKI